MCMCVCMCINIYIYIYIYIYTYTHTHTHIYIYIYTHIYTYTYIHIHIYYIIQIVNCNFRRATSPRNRLKVDLNKIRISYSCIDSKTQKERWAIDDSTPMFYCWNWVILLISILLKLRIFEALIRFLHNFIKNSYL